MLTAKKDVPPQLNVDPPRLGRIRRRPADQRPRLRAPAPSRSPASPARTARRCCSPAGRSRRSSALAGTVVGLRPGIQPETGLRPGRRRPHRRPLRRRRPPRPLTARHLRRHLAGRHLVQRRPDEAQTGHLFGPKPTIEPVGDAPSYVFPVAAPFAHAGNDFIDAGALLRPVPCRAPSPCRRSA